MSQLHDLHYLVNSKWLHQVFKALWNLFPDGLNSLILVLFVLSPHFFLFPLSLKHLHTHTNIHILHCKHYYSPSNLPITPPPKKLFYPVSRFCLGCNLPLGHPSAELPTPVEFYPSKLSTNIPSLISTLSNPQTDSSFSVHPHPFTTSPSLFVFHDLSCKSFTNVHGKSASGLQMSLQMRLL